eukprot:6956696-Karenia_brevis.AAC.1
MKTSVGVSNGLVYLESAKGFRFRSVSFRIGDETYFYGCFRVCPLGRFSKESALTLHEFRTRMDALGWGNMLAACETAERFPDTFKQNTEERVLH